MRIAVCIKQVPRVGADGEMRFHERTNRIVRDEIETIANPLDLEALDHALALRERVGGEVIALSMGPPAAAAVIEEALARGADRGLLLSDRRFAGADTLATARAIARAADRVDADLVLLGRQSLDGATAQLPAQVAELGGRTLVTGATAIEPDDCELAVERPTEFGDERWLAALPAVVSVARGPDAEPSGQEPASAPRPVETLDAEGLGGTPRDYGTRGSPTYVRAVRPLSERAPAASEVASDEPIATPKRSLWVLAERSPGGEDLHPTSFEGIACAREIAGELSAEVVSVILGRSSTEQATELHARGADRVLCVEDAHLDDRNVDDHAAALCAAIESHEPFAIIAPWTTHSNDVVARTSARLGLGLTGDFVALELEPGRDGEDPDLMWIKPAAGAAVEAPIIAHTTPSVGTLRPGAFPIPPRGSRGPLRVDVFDVALHVGHDRADVRATLVSNPSLAPSGPPAARPAPTPPVRSGPPSAA